MCNRTKAVLAVMLATVFLLCILSLIASNASDDSMVVPENAVVLKTEIADVYNNADAIVTIISDDGDYVTSVNLYRMMKARGLKCTVAGVISMISGHLNVWDMYVSEDVIDLVSHSFDHLKMDEGSDASGDAYVLKHEIADAHRFLENRYKKKQIAFVSPENIMCKKGYDILAGLGIQAVRGDEKGYNSLNPEEGTEAGEWFNLFCMPIVGDGVDSKVRNGWIDKAENDGTWLIEMWHNVRIEDDGQFQTLLIPEAEEHLDYIVEKKNSGNIWVATYTEAVKYIKERQNASVTAYIVGDKLFIRSELTDSQMSYDTYNLPLTVNIKVPDGYSLVNYDGVVYGDTLSVDVIPGVTKRIELD